MFGGVVGGPCYVERRRAVQGVERAASWRRSSEPLTIPWKPTHHLQEVLPAVFPLLSTPGRARHASGIGGFNDRTTRFGAPSAHAEGRAADIYLDANIDIEQKIGDLFWMFVRHANELGVDNVIWDLRIWSVSQGSPRWYSKGGPHRDHGCMWS